MASRSTPVSIDGSALLPLELPDVVVDLYHVLGPNGLLPLAKGLQNELSSCGIYLSTLNHTVLELVTSCFILGVPTPLLEDCLSVKMNY